MDIPLENPCQVHDVEIAILELAESYPDGKERKTLKAISDMLDTDKNKNSDNFRKSAEVMADIGESPSGLDLALALTTIRSFYGITEPSVTQATTNDHIQKCIQQAEEYLFVHFHKRFARDFNIFFRLRIHMCGGGGDNCLNIFELLKLSTAIRSERELDRFIVAMGQELQKMEKTGLPEKRGIITSEISNLVRPTLECEALPSRSPDQYGVEPEHPDILIADPIELAETWPKLQYVDRQVIAAEALAKGTLLGYIVKSKGQNALMDNDQPRLTLLESMEGPNVEIHGIRTHEKTTYWFKTSQAVREGCPLTWGLRECWNIESGAIWETHADQVILESSHKCMQETMAELARRLPDRMYAPDEVRQRRAKLHEPI
ncbi:hypothetical protein PMIN03_012255 [Paraphaeosphaeria minitans]